MLGFGAIGVNPVGTGPRSSVAVTVFLTSKINAICSLKGANSPVSKLAGRVTGISTVRPPMGPTGTLSARVKAMASARAPGGLILKTRMTAAAKLASAPGYLLSAKMFLSSAGFSDIHIEGKTTVRRAALLLDSGSQFGASYWGFGQGAAPAVAQNAILTESSLPILTEDGQPIVTET